MASKFFTWTKGDRRNAADALRSGGVVPIPAECISIRGMDYSRSTKGSSKASRKPDPLDLDQSNRSLALHDAAVESATNLMAVMNDMLRSPHLSAHLSAQTTRQSNLQPMHGRPRSHTAPTTPMCEAPQMDPVELPGSTPLGEISHQSLRTETKRLEGLTQSPSHMTFGSDIKVHQRDHSDTQGLARYHRTLSETNLPKPGSLHPPAQISPRSKSSSPHRYSKRVNASLVGTPVRDRPGEERTKPGRKSSRPSLNVLQHWPPESPGLFKSFMSSRESSRQDMTGASYSMIPPNTDPAFTSEHDGPGSFVMSHIAELRATHEAHLASLRYAHEKEIASYRSYITLLERKPKIATLSSHSSKGNLTIDTSQASTKVGDLLSADASATTLQSFESSLENQKRASQEAAAEAEGLKRKLSLCKRARLDAEEVRRERDGLRASAEKNERRILQLKDINKRAKENERSLRNAMEDLRVRLEAANEQRLDVLEGYHEAREKAKIMYERETMLVQALEDLQIVTAEASADQRAERSTGNSDDYNLPEESGSLPTTLDLEAQWRYHQGMHVQQDQRIQDLERENKTLQIGKVSTSETNNEIDTAVLARTSELQSRVTDQQQEISHLRADIERYNSLLHSAIRRQARTMMTAPHATNSNMEAEIRKTETHILKAVGTKLEEFPIATDDAASIADRSELLEKELKNLVNEIIMYKLDCSGYRKDLKAAKARIKSLERALPPTPEKENTSISTSQQSSIEDNNRRDDSLASSSGLGITGAERPSTPTTVASATAAALLSASPQAPYHHIPPPDSAWTPSSRPGTPLSTHKKLPRPPMAKTPTPSPSNSPPSHRMRRAETMRSMSESIISSYAKRSPSNQGTPQSSACNSTPLPHLNPDSTVQPPTSRFTALKMSEEKAQSVLSI